MKIATSSRVGVVGQSAEGSLSWQTVSHVGRSSLLTSTSALGLDLCRSLSVLSKEMKSESLRPSFNSLLFLVDCEGQQCQGTRAESAMSQTVSLYSAGNSRGVLELLQEQKASWTWTLGTLGCEQHFDLGGKALAQGCVLLSCSALHWGCIYHAACALH